MVELVVRESTMARVHHIPDLTPCSRPASFLAAAVGATVLWAADGLARSYQRYRERRALQRLDDHMLSDIGIGRADVDLEANKPFWRS